MFEGRRVRAGVRGTGNPETGSEIAMMRLLLAGLGASTLLVTTGSTTPPPPDVVPTAIWPSAELSNAARPCPHGCTSTITTEPTP